MHDYRKVNKCHRYYFSYSTKDYLLPYADEFFMLIYL